MYHFGVLFSQTFADFSTGCTDKIDASFQLSFGNLKNSAPIPNFFAIIDIDAFSVMRMGIIIRIFRGRKEEKLVQPFSGVINLLMLLRWI